MFLIIKYPKAAYYMRKTHDIGHNLSLLLPYKRGGMDPLPTTFHIKLIWILTLMIQHVHQEGMKEILDSHKTLREKCEFSSRSKKWFERAGKSDWLWILLWLGSGARVRVPLHGLGLS